MPSAYDIQVKKDYGRDIWCLLGLPVDRISMEAAIQEIAWYVSNQKHAVLSTINVNWVVASFSDLPFRQSIVDSDICTIDGKYLIFLSALLGIPITEVVAGSTLTFFLKKQFHSPTGALKMYLFGGDEKIGELAMKKINSENCSVQIVGEMNPGFGPVETKSTPEIINQINECKPDFILVALGAQKGQQWIQLNKYKLNAAVISHLGATINFLAGTVKRAPKLIQDLSFEWAWRIITEPHLFKRYKDDAQVFFSVVFKEWKMISRLKKLEQKRESDGKLEVESTAKLLTLKIIGSITPDRIDLLKSSLLALSLENLDVTVDLQQCQFLCNQALALLLLLAKHKFRQEKSFSLIGVTPELADIFEFHRINLSLKALHFSEYCLATR